MHLHPGEISRRALNYLHDGNTDGSRFAEMAKALEFDERSLSKNLFWLEEHKLVKLSTSLSPASTFPKIVLVKLTREGRELTDDQEKLAQRFPVDQPVGANSYRDYLEMLRDDVKSEKDMDEAAREKALNAIETLLSISLADKKVD